MTRDSRYDILFEPIRIGPVAAKNRFYQVPHCTGMGWRHPRMLAAMRGTKAEGGWGVVCTEWCSIHPTSDDLPYANASIWDAGDIQSHLLMTEAVHEHGALAGVELWHGGSRAQNFFTREVGMDVSSMPNAAGFPFQTRAMDKADIRQLRQWHRDAALRAKQAEFDIVYVYATHGYLLSHFLSAETNSRTDEYGGGLENRVRLVRELIEETKEAVGDRCAVAVRFSAEQGGGTDGEAVIGEHQDMIGMLAELPDLWDININDYSLEMGASRFVKEGMLEPYMSYVKSVTTKPVVTVGRFTSPDTMVSQVKRGIVDFIGAARPSIADPFLPSKIEQGRLDDIRECIGCNICYTGDGIGVPIQCTQNPTINEVWRRGWHPENFGTQSDDQTVLVVGAGPAGLEAAHVLGKRGYNVYLAEASTELGGRVSRESKLPGLNEWARVRDYRVGQIQKMPNVEMFLDSRMKAEDVFAVDADHIAIATGATWRRDGVGRFNLNRLEQFGPDEQVFTFDDIADGRFPEGPTLIFDNDEYYHGSTIAELLSNRGNEVVFVTPGSVVSSFSRYTGEQHRVQNRLMECGVEIITSYGLSGFDGKQATISSVYNQANQMIEVQNVVTVTNRIPSDHLYNSLMSNSYSKERQQVQSIRRIGDCEAPGLIASAIFSGHQYGRSLGLDAVPEVKFDRLFFQHSD